MKLRQPREAMPLTVWMALAVLAFGSVAYLVGILLFDDFLALFSEKKMSERTISSRAVPCAAGELAIKRGWLELPRERNKC